MTAHLLKVVTEYKKEMDIMILKYVIAQYFNDSIAE